MSAAISPAARPVESPSALPRLAESASFTGRLAVRFGLVAILAWIGGMKFTAYEAEAISGLVQNSPLLAWNYSVLSVRQLGVAIGVTELIIAALISLRYAAPRASVVGSLLAVGMFLTTLSFLFTTPGVIEPSLGFPGLSVMPGQFLIKDLALLGAALWTLGDSLEAAVAPEG